VKLYSSPRTFDLPVHVTQFDVIRDKTVIDTRIFFSAKNPYCTTVMHGHAIAQAVSRWLPTAVARVLS
jgi:hypothetical protein